MAEEKTLLTGLQLDVKTNRILYSVLRIKEDGSHQQYWYSIPAVELAERLYVYGEESKKEDKQNWDKR